MKYSINQEIFSGTFYRTHRGKKTVQQELIAGYRCNFDKKDTQSTTNKNAYGAREYSIVSSFCHVDRGSNNKLVVRWHGYAMAENTINVQEPTPNLSAMQGWLQVQRNDALQQQRVKEHVSKSKNNGNLDNRKQYDENSFCDITSNICPNLNRRQPDSWSGFQNSQGKWKNLPNNGLALLLLYNYHYHLVLYVSILSKMTTELQPIIQSLFCLKRQYSTDADCIKSRPNIRETTTK